jgi:hypothetical protein
MKLHTPRTPSYMPRLCSPMLAYGRLRSPTLAYGRLRSHPRSRHLFILISFIVPLYLFNFFYRSIFIIKFLLSFHLLFNYYFRYVHM